MEGERLQGNMERPAGVLRTLLLAHYFTQFRSRRWRQKVSIFILHCICLKIIFTKDEERSGSKLARSRLLVHAKKKPQKFGFQNKF